MPANQKQQKIGKVPILWHFHPVNAAPRVVSSAGLKRSSVNAQRSMQRRSPISSGAFVVRIRERWRRWPKPSKLTALCCLAGSDTLATGVGVRPGSEAAKRMGAAGVGADEDGGLKAAGWDEEPPVPAEIEELRAYWRDHPDQWAALSETGRRTLSEKMFGAPEAGWLGQG